MSIQRAIIIGGGIAGVASAIALTRHNGISCSIYEIRTEPATIGGAIHLTPNALRYLDYLGVLPRLEPMACHVNYIEVSSLRTGQRLGTIGSPDSTKSTYYGLRVMRHLILDAMLQTLKEMGIEVQYDMKISSIVESNENVTAKFEDGTTVEGDILLGCDGIHSAVRQKFVQPERKPEYTGVATCFGILSDISDFREKIPIESTTLFSGRFGSLLLSYADAPKRSLYLAAVMAAKDVGSREGWTAKGRDNKSLKADMLKRFSAPVLPFLGTAVGRIEAFTLYPVYRLSENGVWCSGRLILLGDAAHAMPPQGESLGLALEDVVLFSRVLEYKDTNTVKELFDCYERNRRPRIDAAVAEANFGFETIKDRGWFGTIVMEWLTWAVLSWRASRKEKEFRFDVRDIELGL